MANLETRPNLTPILDADRTVTSEDVDQAQQLLDYLTNVPLGRRPEVTLGKVSVGFGGWLDGYDFVVVRRFWHNGELIVGGENGEIFNASASVTRARELMELHQKV